MPVIYFTKEEPKLELIDTIIIIKASALNRAQMIKHYINPLVGLGISPDRIVATSIAYDMDNKLKAKDAKEQIARLLKGAATSNIKYIIFADATAYKYYLGVQTLKGIKGTVKEKEFLHDGVLHTFKATYIPNYQTLEYNPSNQVDLDLGLTAVSLLVQNKASLFSASQIHSAEYITEPEQCIKVLEKLQNHLLLAADLETTSLRFDQAKVLTIGFAWSQHDGVVLHINKDPILLKHLGNFFETTDSTIIWWNKPYDVKVLVAQIYMRNLSDLTGMRRGLAICENHHDAQAISFVVQNTVEDLSMKLKDQAYSYLGDYGIDVDDAETVPLSELMEYNLKDALGTFHLFNRDFPLLCATPSLFKFYSELLLPSQTVTMEMELTGLPIDLSKVQALSRLVNNSNAKLINKLRNMPKVIEANWLIARRKADEDNITLKTKIRTPSEKFELFNPNSGAQLQVLLYEILQLPVLGLTEKKQPSTSVKILHRLNELDLDSTSKEVIHTLISISELSGIISTFIPAFLTKNIHRNTENEIIPVMHTLNGNLNTTKVQSLRLSSSDPNLQNLPSGSAYGKKVKECFVAPTGWVIAGIDFASLEDRIKALRTLDPALTEVYTKGYDGHSLKTSKYWPIKFKDHQKPLSGKAYKVVKDDVVKYILEAELEPGQEAEEISLDDWHVHKVNSIKNEFEFDRNRSKPITFALSYKGNAHTLVAKSGFSQEEADSIYDNYMQMHKVSTEWEQMITQEAANKGYIELAFGARLKVGALEGFIITPKLSPHLQGIVRSIANAIIQSYGLLLSRALVDFRRRLTASEFSSDVLLLNCIHDSAYLLIREDSNAIEWVNKNIVECFSWKELPELCNIDIPLTAELEIGKSWASLHTIPNNATPLQITTILKGLENA